MPQLPNKQLFKKKYVLLIKDLKFLNFSSKLDLDALSLNSTVCL